MIYVKNDSSSYGIQGALRVRSVLLFQASSSLRAVGHPCGACCFQNCIQCDRVSDDRCSTALMQACKRGAPSAGVVSSTECSAEVPCTSIRVAVHKLSVNKCMLCSQLHSMRLTMVAGSATLVQGCERSFSRQGLGLVSKCSAKILDRQLVSAVLRFSVG